MISRSGPSHSFSFPLAYAVAVHGEAMKGHSVLPLSVAAPRSRSGRRRAPVPHPESIVIERGSQRVAAGGETGSTEDRRTRPGVRLSARSHEETPWSQACDRGVDRVAIDRGTPGDHCLSLIQGMASIHMFQCCIRVESR